MAQKSFFKENSVGQIKGYHPEEILTGLVNRILNLSDDEGVIIERGIIPQIYSDSRKFMKHGKEIKLQRYSSLENMLKDPKTPVHLRRDAFDPENIKYGAFCGYSFKPFIGNDKRTRKVSLVECLKGAELYAYVNQDNITGFRPEIEIIPYDDCRGVEKDGAEIVAKVPSRKKGEGKYVFKFNSVPVIDYSKRNAGRKYGLAFNIATDHSCGNKRFNIRYKSPNSKESSNVFNFCAHEIAAYLSIIDYYKNERQNLTPLQMSQFALPTQLSVDFYKKLGNNCLIQTEDKKPRKLNSAEKEILLWGLVSKFGHDDTFYATEKLRDYNWKK